MICRFNQLLKNTHMNIFQKFEAEHGYRAALRVVHDNDFDIMGYAAIREAMTLRQWLWDTHSIWFSVDRTDKGFRWVIQRPSIGGIGYKDFETQQEACIDAFVHIYTAFDFINHQFNKQQ
jgi:hypothetical protein